MNFRFQDLSSESDSEDEDKSLKPVTCIGLQPGSNVFVLGPHIQFYSNGRPVPPEEQKFKYISFLLRQLGVMQVSAPVYNLPEVDEPLVQVIDGVYRVGGKNAMWGLFCLGK